MSQLPETRTRYDAAMREWYLRGSNRGEPPPRKEDYPDVYDGPPEESTSPLPQDGRIDKRTGPREEPIFIPRNLRRSRSLGYGAGRSLSQREEPPWWERGTIGPIKIFLLQ